MRVLAMVHAYPPVHNAGGELTMHAMLRHLASRGHDVDVLLSRPHESGPRDYEFEGVHVTGHRSGGDPFKWFGPKADRTADIVIAHLENTLRAAALCGIHKVPMVHLLHNNHEFTKGALRRGPAQLAVFNTNWLRADYQADWSFHTRNPLPPNVVVHPPVDPAPFSKVKPGTHLTLVNLNEDKGGEQFWRLAETLPARKFLGVTGAYGPQVIDDLHNVEILDHQSPDAMPAVYARTKVLLMPSIYESYGRTAIEAAYAGIPTIAHPTPGLIEALGDSGTFVDRDDLDGWRAAISRLMTPKGWAKASAAARAHANSINTLADLDRFADAMEGVVRRGFASIAR